MIHKTDILSLQDVAKQVVNTVDLTQSFLHSFAMYEMPAQQIVLLWQFRCMQMPEH